MGRLEAKRMNRKFESIIRSYIKAKDENKPHLMSGVFSESATLAMEIYTDNISFPSEVVGLADINQTLVRDFNHSYENVYTFCLIDTLEQRKNILSCRWLVGMTEKSSGSCRVGFGEYQWNFVDDGSYLADYLTIVIENMAVLPSEAQTEVMAWLSELPYPWALSSDVSTSIPDIELLSALRSSFV